MGHNRMWSDARRAASRRPPRVIFALGVAAAVAALAAVGHCAPQRALSPPPHALAPVLSSIAEGATSAAVQPQLVNGLPLCKWSTVFATAASPQSAVGGFVALGVVLAAAAATGSRAQGVAAGGRGPPHGVFSSLTGQDLLTRFCTSRR
ncbi:hypothetical protein F0Q45_15630 [Mycobacterium simiae]|uniref:Lipoprotein LpqS n=1 Tax=Mycobacterium simiae TaxID=1784 RepID=A0A5B1BNI0_MYCSI|nr:hypothetical protein [Mycobacterium simiae]KAA1249345.1 hypothetical protein F0Q45_15630 [Mycobacterium simiae]